MPVSSWTRHAVPGAAGRLSPAIFWRLLRRLAQAHLAQPALAGEVLAVDCWFRSLEARELAMEQGRVHG